MQLRPDVFGLGCRGDHPLDELVLELGHDGRRDGGLGLEVVVQRAPGDAGTFGDLVPARGGKALVGEELPRRLDEGGGGRGRAVGLGAPGPADGGRRRLCGVVMWSSGGMPVVAWSAYMGLVTPCMWVYEALNSLVSLHAGSTHVSVL